MNKNLMKPTEEEILLNINQVKDLRKSLIKIYKRKSQKGKRPNGLNKIMDNIDDVLSFLKEKLRYFRRNFENQSKIESLYINQRVKINNLNDLIDEQKFEFEAIIESYKVNKTKDKMKIMDLNKIVKMLKKEKIK